MSHRNAIALIFYYSSSQRGVLEIWNKRDKVRQQLDCNVVVRHGRDAVSTEQSKGWWQTYAILLSFHTISNDSPRTNTDDHRGYIKYLIESSL